MKCKAVWENIVPRLFVRVFKSVRRMPHEKVCFGQVFSELIICIGSSSLAKREDSRVKESGFCICIQEV